MSDALTKIMNLPCAGFDNDGEETVNREAAAEIANEADARIAELEARLAEMKSAYENLYHQVHHGASVAYEEQA